LLLGATGPWLWELFPFINSCRPSKKISFISLYLETGGEYCGICQLSAVFKDMEGKDIIDPFGFYVKPPSMAIWNPKLEIYIWSTSVP
jgi:hypothetical protein